MPEVRVISVEHGRTTEAASLLRHALDAHGLRDCRVFSVFCHLEAGRCGIPSGKVAVEVDGRVVWMGAELSEPTAAEIGRAMVEYIERPQ